MRSWLKGSPSILWGFLMEFLGSANSIWKRACRCAISDGVPRRSLYIALIVGTVLNLINQGDALLGLASINWLKLILTYCVPYAVCTYGFAVSYQLKKADVTLERRA
jgi:hypothetical protein